MLPLPDGPLSEAVALPTTRQQQPSGSAMTQADGKGALRSLSGDRRAPRHERVSVGSRTPSDVSSLGFAQEGNGRLDLDA
jgi:hypothetical protein